MFSPIGENTEGFKEAGPSLYLVDDHKTPQRLERQHRILEPGQILGTFKVEAFGSPRETTPHLTRQRGLADLPGAKNADHREGPQQLTNRGNVLLAIDHAGIVL